MKSVKRLTKGRAAKESPHCWRRRGVGVGECMMPRAQRGPGRPTEPHKTAHSARAPSRVHHGLPGLRHGAGGGARPRLGGLAVRGAGVAKHGGAGPAASH